MAKECTSSSASLSKAPVSWGSGHGTTPGGSQVGAHQTRYQTRAHANLPAVVPTVALPKDVVMGLLNVLEALVPNHGGLPVPQTTFQAQTQVRLNVAAT
ncbi:hypothetical protein HAX54_022777 [Datura stramonium]|uniref:Uncharacterized protein n=1 Tax=Datura stramonium TaxID=4076 RepID=A0ABS8UXW4_DATST|nr:hypothetical protein [Datura stramonium]